MAEKEPEVHVNRMLALVVVTSGLGGFLFGYDSSAISASLLQIRYPNTSLTCPGLASHWLGNFALEQITSCAVLGAFVASVFAGYVNDHLGRRGVLIVAALCFGPGAILMGVAWSIPSMLAARFIAGVGVGFGLHTMPCYVSECSPASIRGMMVLTGNIMLVLGQTAAAGYSAVMFYAEIKYGWRWILGVGCVPAVFMLVGLMYLPESPRWLLSKGRESEAKEALRSLRAGYDEFAIEREFQAMVEGVNEEFSRIPITPPEETMLTTLSKRYWTDAGVRRALFLGCSLNGLTQLIGINAIMYYGPSVLVMASGSGSPIGATTQMDTCFTDSNNLSVALNTVLSAGQALGIMTSFLLIEHVGRRPLLLASLLGAVVGLSGVGMSFATHYVDEGLVTVFVLIYVYMFGAGVAGVPWVVNSEIYPLHVRAQCLSFANATHWFMNFIVSATFLSLANSLSTDRGHPYSHPDGVFFLYALIALVGFGVLCCKMPETKGLTLEEASRLFACEEEQKLLS